MNLETWSLTGSTFHFGEQGLGQEETRAVWSSDSLFAALVARLAVLEGAQAVKEWIQSFDAGAPSFLLTSLFPFAGEVRFFPVPLAAALPNDQPLPKEIRPKDLKRVQFVSESLYRDLLTGKSLVEIEPGTKKLHGGKLWLTQDEEKSLSNLAPKGELLKLWEIEKRPRVTVERATNSSTLFHTGAVHFAPGCGLWFGVQWQDETRKALFERLLHDLGEAGLGAERSAGYGKGKFEPKETLELPDPRGMWTTLSRYLPRPEETPAFSGERAAWKVETVGGWLDSPQKSGQRRRALNFVQEGAVLSLPAGLQPPFGRLEDARPRYKSGPEYPIEHPVYRSGLAVAVGYGGEA
ncbi:MAG: type III-A CRISPR-associated RAMP protein Csm4 [Chloroflexota bacterium]|jgi:CRISPR-associated protein Csm4